jgi:hypothetical protein
MPVLKQLTKNNAELWKEYEKFLEINKLTEKDVINVCFIYGDKYLNKGCLSYNPNLTNEECCMYNLTVDDDCNRILVDNDYGTIYVKLKNDIVAFRCTNYCLKSKNYRFLNQWIVDKVNMPRHHFGLLTFFLE